MSEINLGVRYKAKVASHVVEQDAKGQPFIMVTFAIEDEAHGKRIYLTEKSIGIARANLKAMGFDCETRSLKELDENPFLLAGNDVEVDFTTWESNQGSVLQINNIYGKKVPKSEDFFSALDKSIREVKKSSKPSTKPAKKATAKAAPPSDEEEIPF